ncbi:putative voltage gated chloride channel [Obelidium mucronatum]|nr:putative voltage gated chloride channel [Obelidium mucronatum]
MPKDPDDFDTIDWVQDTSADHQRRRKLQLTLADSPLESAFESMQSWILVLILGFSLGLVAAFIDIVAAWLTDVRLGYCETEWYLSRTICCTVFSRYLIKNSSGDCPKWSYWSDSYILKWMIYIFFSTIFASVVAVIVVKVAPNAAGSGTAEIKTILGGFATSDFLDGKTFIVKSMTLPLTVASGLAVGKEGPMIHVASCLAGILPDFFPKYRDNEGRKREILSVAAASGVAVAFGAPIGGVLFSLEELSSFFPAKTMLRSYFCALVSCVMLQFIDPYRGKRVLIEVSFSRNWLFFETTGFLLLGVFGGLSGAFVIRMSQKAARFRKSGWVKTHPILEVVIVASFTAFVGYINPLTRPQGHVTAVLLLIIALILRIGLTVVSLGLKVPAGIFIPSMVWGGLFGRLVGIGMEAFQKGWPDLPMFSSCTPDKPCVTPGMYALLGAIGALGGVTRLTLSLTVIMFELTGTLNYIVPCMIVLMVAKLVGDAFGKGGMSDAQIKVFNYPHLEITEDLSLDFIGRPIQDAMTPYNQLVVLKKTLLSIDEAEQIILENTGFRGYPVVRSLRGREFMGFINLLDIIQAVEAAKNEGFVETDPHIGGLPRGIRSSGDGRDRPLMHHISDSMVDLAPYLNRTPLTVHPKLHLEAVMDMFKKLGPRYIVILHNGRLEGLITKKDILKAVHEFEHQMKNSASYTDQDDMGSLFDGISLLPRV